MRFYFPKPPAVIIAPLVLCAVVAAAIATQHPLARAAALFAGSDQQRITAVVARDKPSVVAIEVTAQAASPAEDSADADTDGDAAGNDGPAESHASGSGFVYASDGTIVTNAHVVAPPNGERIERLDVVFANGDRVPGTVSAIDRGADLALVRVAPYAKLPPPLPLGHSAALRAGQWAIAIGEPLELRDTVTVGVVSGFDRSEPIGDESGGDVRTFSGLLQTSAPINPGNSGGPLIDLDGRVIGINQSVVGDAQNIGFAIPIDTVRTVVAALQTQPGDVQPDGAEALATGMHRSDRLAWTATE